MPDSIRNERGWTLRKLIQNTYHHFPTRIENARRDRVRIIRIKKISVYGDLEPGQARTKYIIESRSTPQYWPYFTKRDRWGRRRTFQRSHQHQYDVTIQLDRLSIDSDRIRLRTGADKKWRFGRQHRARRDAMGRVIEGTNPNEGINGDFFFRLSWVYRNEGLLFGRNWASGPPDVRNPHYIVFLDKHMLNTVQTLVNMGVLSEG